MLSNLCKPLHLSRGHLLMSCGESFSLGGTVTLGFVLDLVLKDQAIAQESCILFVMVVGLVLNNHVLFLVSSCNLHLSCVVMVPLSDGHTLSLVGVGGLV